MVDNLIILLSLTQTLLTGFFVYTYYTHLQEIHTIRKWSNRILFGIGGASIASIGIENIYSECIKQLRAVKADIRNEYMNESSSHHNEYNHLQKEINNLKSMYEKKNTDEYKYKYKDEYKDKNKDKNKDISSYNISLKS